MFKSRRTIKEQQEVIEEQRTLINKQQKTIREQNDLLVQQVKIIQMYSEVLGIICKNYNITELTVPLYDMIIPNNTPQAKLKIYQDPEKNEFKAKIRLEYT